MLTWLEFKRLCFLFSLHLIVLPLIPPCHYSILIPCLGFLTFIFCELEHFEMNLDFSPRACTSFCIFIIVYCQKIQIVVIVPTDKECELPQNVLTHHQQALCCLSNVGCYINFLQATYDPSVFPFYFNLSCSYILSYMSNLSVQVLK